MRNLNPSRMCMACVAAIALASGTALAQETRSQAPEQRSQAQEQGPQQRDPVPPQQHEERERQAPGKDDATPLLENPAVETGDEEGIVPDGQHADELHWSKGTMPEQDTLIGSEVVNRDYEVVGRVVDLILDEDEGILEVVVEVNERMGLGARKVAIPVEELEAVHAEEQEFHLVLDTDLKGMKDAPE